MVILAALAMTLAHPGIYFEGLRSRKQEGDTEKNGGKKSSSFPAIKNIVMVRGFTRSGRH
jgi:hypothetical protein